MKNQTRLYLTMLTTLSFGSVAAAQDFDSSTISVSTGVRTSCTIQSLPTASRELTSEVRALQSEADRMMCLRDGAVFTTQLEGEVRVSVLAPGTDGVLGITDHYLASEDVDRLGWGEICDVGASMTELRDADTSLDSAGGRRLGWSEICDVGLSLAEICDVDTSLDSADGRRLGWSELCDVGASLTLGSQEGEPVRAVLDAMVSYTNAPDSLLEGAYKAGFLCLNQVGDDAQLANVDLQSGREGCLPALWEGAYKAGLICLNQLGDDAQLANVDMHNCNERVADRTTCSNEINSGAQRPDNGLIAVVIITAIMDTSN